VRLRFPIPLVCETSGRIVECPASCRSEYEETIPNSCSSHGGYWPIPLLRVLGQGTRTIRSSKTNPRGDDHDKPCKRCLRCKAGPSTGG
jgi:hypothetical protein